MRQNVLRGGAVSLMAAALLLWPGTSFAFTPTLGTDCGAGASIVGSQWAGKVTMGAGTTTTCMLTFTSPFLNAPACVATNETNGRPIGTQSTASTVLFVADPLTGASLSSNDVVSYICMSY